MIITALIGFPTKHSVSPVLFSLYASQFDIEYTHLKIDVLPKNLKKVICSVKILGIRGLNITLPYKMSIIKLLDVVDKKSLKIGAVNTIVNKNGKLYGYNTDSYGAIASIKSHIPSLKSKKIVIFGTGGAASALISGFLDNESSVTVSYRNPKSLNTMRCIENFGEKIKFIENNKFNLTNAISDADIVCNATSCGMAPNSNNSPVLNSVLRKSAHQSTFNKKLFFDVIFNPYKTKFLEDAESLGASIQGGTEMMIYQGVEAFKLWTGLQVNNHTIARAKSVLQKKLIKNK